MVLWIIRLLKKSFIQYYHAIRISSVDSIYVQANEPSLQTKRSIKLVMFNFVTECLSFKRLCFELQHDNVYKNTQIN